MITCLYKSRRRLLCQACFSDCTVSRKYVEKEMNVYDDRLLELSHLPFAFNYLSSKTYRGWWGGKPDEFLLKEDVAGLYQTTWELFVKDAAARATRRCFLAPDSKPHPSSSTSSFLLPALS